jgi:rhamnose transport system permease protein
LLWRWSAVALRRWPPCTSLSPYRVETALGLVILALAAVLAVAAPRFFEPANLADLVLANLPVLIAAVGATLVILTGEIDISVGSTFAVCSVVAGTLATIGAPVPAVALGTLAVGAAIGTVNGLLVAWLHIPSIVVTLAAMVALRDGLRWITEGAWVQNLPASFQWFGLTQQLYPTIAVGIAVLISALTAWTMRSTRAGRVVFATGSNAEAARLAAIDTAAVRLSVFALAGVFTAIAAIVNAVRFTQVPPNTGLGFEMKVIAAVVVGGAAITGGRGSIAGTVLGTALLGMSGPALTFLGASAYWERALQGGIILAAVAIQAITRTERAVRRAAGTSGVAI